MGVGIRVVLKNGAPENPQCLYVSGSGFSEEDGVFSAGLAFLWFRARELQRRTNKQSQSKDLVRRDRAV